MPLDKCNQDHRKTLPYSKCGILMSLKWLDCSSLTKIKDISIASKNLFLLNTVFLFVFLYYS